MSAGTVQIAWGGNAKYEKCDTCTSSAAGCGDLFFIRTDEKPFPDSFNSEYPNRYMWNLCADHYADWIIGPYSFYTTGGLKNWIGSRDASSQAFLDSINTNFPGVDVRDECRDKKYINIY